MKLSASAMLAAVWLLAAAPRAGAIPIGPPSINSPFDGPLRDYLTGSAATVLGGVEALRYNATSDILSYTASSTFSSHLLGEFDGLLLWSALVTEDEVVANPGSMLWFGDFGSGLELLASGHLRYVEAPGTFSWDPPIFEKLSGLFAIDFLDARVAGMGNHMWFDFSFDLYPGLPAISFFSNDFECTYVWGAVPEPPTCGPWSWSGLLGLQLPEPGTLALFCLGLLGLGFTRRRHYNELTTTK